jgi:hypothetical protein
LLAAVLVESVTVRAVAEVAVVTGLLLELLEEEQALSLPSRLQHQQITQ